MKNINKPNLTSQVANTAKTFVVITLTALASVLSSCDDSSKGKYEITFVVFYDEDTRDTITLEANDRSFEYSVDRGTNEIKSYDHTMFGEAPKVVFETTAPIKVLENK